jgi:hypothetical protein
MVYKANALGGGMGVVVFAIVDCRDPMSRVPAAAQAAGEAIAVRLFGPDHGIEFKRRDNAHPGPAGGDVWTIRFDGPSTALHDQLAVEFAVLVDGRVSRGVTVSDRDA